jgi:S1-C subfamily serine protease
VTRQPHGRLRSCVRALALTSLALTSLLLSALLLSAPAWARDNSPVTSAAASVVKVVAVQGPGVVEDGSGFVVDQNRILTNQHVVGDADAVTVIFSSGTRRSCPVIAASHPRDLALLNCATGTIPVLQLSSGPYLGEKVAALGHPGGGPLRVTEGSVTNSVPDEAGYVTIDARLIPGNSGGPVIDTSTGEVIGVGSAFDPNASGVDFAIPDATLVAFLHNPPAPVPAGPTTNGGEWIWALGVGIVFGLAAGYALRSRTRRQSNAPRGLFGQVATTQISPSAAPGEPIVILHGLHSSNGTAVGQWSSATERGAESESDIRIVLHPTGTRSSSTSGSIHSSTDGEFRDGISTTKGDGRGARITVVDP